jgi:hypothetical protein
MRRIAGLLSLFCLLSACGARAEVEAVQALITSSISRNLEARRPLESIGIPSAAYYYVKAKGLQPGRTYQVDVTVLDAAKHVVARHRFTAHPRKAEHAIWLGFRTRAGHAPGTWTFSMDLDERPLARTEIRAGPDGDVAKTARYERYAPVTAGLVILGLLGYLVFGLRASRSVTIAATAPARSIADPALFALVAANLLPLALAYFGAANAADLLFIYWTENFVIALYAIARIAMARGPGSQKGVRTAVIGFILLFGMMTSVHSGVLMYLVWDHSNFLELQPRQPREPFNVVPLEFAVATLSLLVSHGVSFVQNYLRRGEFLVTTPVDEMKRPLDRVMTMHIAGVAVGVFAMGQGSPLLMLAVLVAVKTGMDIHAHVRSHARVLRRA